jgi:hypothetical protein
MTSTQHTLSTLGCAVALCFGAAAHAQAIAKIAITKQADLPRFS